MPLLPEYFKGDCPEMELEFLNPTHQKSTEAKAGLPGGKMLITKLQEVRRMALQAQDNSGISGA